MRDAILSLESSGAQLHPDRGQQTMDFSTIVQARIDRFPESCRQAGLKITPQRTAVFRMLAGTESHPTPEEVYSAIRGSLPSVSLGTVYKILDQFYRSGLLRKVSTEDTVARYDANLDPHHHLVCDACGRIQDVKLELPHLLEASASAQPDFRITHFDLFIHGRCKACQALAAVSSGQPG